MRLLIPIAVAIVASGLVIIAVLRKKRRDRVERDIPELNQHPERLEQMLDSTDDA
jgi:hypothetical protein